MRNIWSFITFILCLLYNPPIQSQEAIAHDDLIALSQKSVADAVKILHEKLEGFDRECFLLGTMDDNMGHYQTFTANKSLDDVGDFVKWMFEKESEFIPDTMACRRITTYSTNGNGSWHTDLALLAVALFKDDYNDVRALRVCNHCSPPQRHYGSEIKSLYDKEDPVCKKNPDLPLSSAYEIELYSSSLVKAITDYYTFDMGKPFLPVISSGGDIGYRGVINRKKISTRAQKLSFLTGIFMRYGCNRINEQYEAGYYSISIPNSLSAATVCSDILQEMGCEKVVYIDKFPYGHQIFFITSVEVEEIKNLTNLVQKELDSKRIAF